MVKVGIVGGTGYTGVELLRLLALHRGVHVEVLTSRQESGKRADQLFPQLRGQCASSRIGRKRHQGNIDFDFATAARANDCR